MRKISSIIQEHILEKETFFVFPSEVAASSWRKRMLKEGLVCIRSDRFISWDTFKETIFDTDSSRRPVNALLRSIFLMKLLSENASSVIFHRLVEAEYAENSKAFLPSLMPVLPGLKQLWDYPEFDHAIDKRLLADYRLLYARYKDFLNKHDLFEPSWEDWRTGRIEGQYYVFYPDLLEDFAEAASFLEEEEQIHLVYTKREASPPLLRFDNSVAEIRYVLGRIEELLDEGIVAEDIAISLANSESYRDHLSYHARLYEVPLNIREGRTLSEYPGGWLFSRIAEWVEDGFSVEGAKALLLNHAIPWKEREAGERITLYGLEKNCIGRYSYKGRMTDSWRQILSHVDPNEVSEKDIKWFEACRSSLRKIYSASTVKELRSEVFSFLFRFIEPENWDPMNMRVLQISLDILGELFHAESSFGIVIDSPLETWTSLSKAKLYVPKSDTGGIAVYPYRVSAGIAPEYQFILNADHGATSSVYAPFSFLRDDYKAKLGIQNRDLSHAFFSAYCNSGESVCFSYAEKSFAGPALPPSYFVAENNIIPAEANEARRGDNFYDWERDFWKGSQVKRPSRAYPLQVQGLRYANTTAFADKGTDYTETNIEEPTIRELLYAEQGLPSQLKEHTEASSAQGLAFAANHLETYKACPFAYLLKRGLRLSEQRYQTDLENAQDLGTYYHYLLEKLFIRIRDKDKAFRPDNVGKYRLWLDDIIIESLENAYCSERGLIPSVVLSLKPKIEELIGKLLEEEAGHYSGFLLRSLEKWYWRIEKEIDVILYGKIDRVSENPESGTILLIDYKKKKLPSKSEILGAGGDPQSISSFQMALYLYLLEGQGQVPLEAAYYSLEDYGFKAIYGRERPLMDEEQKNLVIHQLERTINETAERIREGNYQIPLIDADSCPFRSICRNRYTTAV